jgi:hypothetical protein
VPGAVLRLADGQRDDLITVLADFKRAHGIAVGWAPNVDRYDRGVAGHIHVITWNRRMRCRGPNPRAVPGAVLRLAGGQRGDLFTVLAGGQPQTSPRHRRGMGAEH